MDLLSLGREVSPKSLYSGRCYALDGIVYPVNTIMTLYTYLTADDSV